MEQNNKKAYFVDSQDELIYELSAAKRKQLEKTHPDWTLYECDSNYHELIEVFDFFQTHGKLLACPKFKNIFSGLTA